MESTDFCLSELGDGVDYLPSKIKPTFPNGLLQTPKLIFDKTAQNTHISDKSLF